MERIPKSDDDTQRPGKEISSNSRRRFLGKMGVATVAAGLLGKTPVAFAQSGRPSGSAIANTGVSPTFSGREQYALRLRIATAQKDFHVPVPLHTTNGDEQLYPDHSASYSKGLRQDAIGVVNPAAWVSFKKALQTGQNDDFEALSLERR